MNQRVIFSLSKKPEVYDRSIDILDKRRKSHIQTCGKNEDGYLSAWKKFDKTVGDWRKKRGEETKKQF